MALAPTKTSTPSAPSAPLAPGMTGSESMYKPYVIQPPTPSYDIGDGQKTTDITAAQNYAKTGSINPNATTLTWDQISKMGLMPNSKTVTDPTQTGQTPAPTGTAQAGAPKAGSAPLDTGNTPPPTGKQGDPEIVKKYQGLKSMGQPPGVDLKDNPRAHIDAAGGVLDSQGSSNLDSIFQTDPAFGEMIKQFTDYMSPQNQRQSLTDTYKSLVKDSGVQELNTELINMKNVIDGSEDDIRNEINKAGGFATDSQVLALTNSRNKQLIKNYNTLLDTKNSKDEYLKTMIGLEQSDREMADNRADKMMNFGLQILNYRDKMQENAQNSYQKIVDNIGYKGLLDTTKGDPHSINLIESALGLGAGGLTKAAAIPPEVKTTAIPYGSGHALVNSQTGNVIQVYPGKPEEPNGGTVTLSGKPQNTEQSKANGFADRLNESNIIIDSIGSKFTGNFDYGDWMPNFLQSADRQSFEQAKKNFITAVLRRESGAAISPTEFTTEALKYFPQAGDKPETVTQKSNARNTAINNLYRESNVSRPVMPGMIIQSEGKKYKVESDGATLTEIK